jgi:F-type H+-transporting ATPase subunit b
MRIPHLLLGFALSLAPVLAQQHEPAAPAQHEPAAAQHEPAGTAQPGEAPQHAQSHGEAKEHGKSEGHGEGHGNLEIWKWANFLLLAGGLGYLIGKNAGPFFATRSQQIRKDMAEAEEMRRQAEARAAEVDRRLANLQTEIEALRLDAQQQQAAEAERVRKHTVDDIAKIQQNSEQEIAAAGKAARTELKRYSAELALELAERRLRSGITPDAQDALVTSFVQDLGRTS